MLSRNYFTSKLATVNLSLGKCKCSKSNLSESVSSSERNCFGACRASLLSSLPALLGGRRGICASVWLKKKKL